MADAKPLKRRLREAVTAGHLDAGTAEAGLAAGILSASEAQILREAAVATQEVIAVDDFAAEDLAVLHRSGPPRVVAA